MKNTELRQLLQEHHPQHIIDTLSPFILAPRKERIEAIIANRIDSISIAVECPSDSLNASAIVRSAEAFGVATIHIITPEENTYFAMQGISQGACFWIQVNIHPTLEDFITQIKQENKKLIGAVVNTQNTLTDISIDEPCCLFFGNENIKENLDKVGLNLPENLDDAIKKSIQKKFTAIKKKCSDKLTTEETSPEKHQERQRTLLREILQDFRKLQGDITLAQRSAGDIGVTANETATNAIQNALYIVQNDPYSAYGCHEGQLWINNESQSNKPKVLDTAKLSGIRQEDALFAASLLGNSKKSGVTTQLIEDAKKDALTAHNNIQEQHIKLKENIDHARKQDPNGGGYILSSLGVNRDGYLQQTNLSSQTRKIINYGEKKYSDLIKDTDIISAQQTAHVYQPGDLLSAIGNFSYAFGEYFSKELAAKHPAITTAAFIGPQIMLTAAAFNVHFGPHVLQALAGEANKGWFWLTKTKSASEKLIMAGFAEPKILYFMVEKVLKEMTTGEHKTTFDALEQLLSSGDINTDTATDAARKNAQTLLKATIYLSLACCLGMGAAHFLPAKGLLGKGKKLIETFDNVTLGDFKSFVDASGMAAHAEAFAQLFGVLLKPPDYLL